MIVDPIEYRGSFLDSSIHSGGDPKDTWVVVVGLSRATNHFFFCIFGGPLRANLCSWGG